MAWSGVTAAMVLLVCAHAVAQDNNDDANEPNPDLSVDDTPDGGHGQPRPEAPKLPPPTEAKRLDPNFDVWVDKQRGIVIVDGQVSLRAGPLEMFACPKGTKEHESIVACNTKAFVVHAGLLHVGAETGTPVRYDEEYHPPTGTQVDIDIYWIDTKGNRQKARAQDWVRDVRTKKAMDLPWVFAGSGFWEDETTGERVYLAESGDFICVSNFSTAMLDVPAESTQANDGLYFEAFTDKVPPLGTWVRLVLRPQLKQEPAPTNQ